MKSFTTLKQHTVSFIEATELLPASWDSWFWQMLSEDAPFCWGTNNRSLVDPKSLKEHVVRCLEHTDDAFFEGGLKKEVAEFLALLDSFPADVYIDLEN